MAKKRMAELDSGNVPRRSPPSAQSALGWSLLAGLCFAIARLGAGSFAMWMFGLSPESNDPAQRSVMNEARTMAWAATGSAGVVGLWIWHSLVASEPSARAGAFAGLKAAIFSYVGIVAFITVTSLTKDGDTGWSLLAGVMCGVSSVMFTGVVVFPALMLTGATLGWMQERIGRSSGPAR